METNWFASGTFFGEFLTESNHSKSEATGNVLVGIGDISPKTESLYMDIFSLVSWEDNNNTKHTYDTYSRTHKSILNKHIYIWGLF